MHTLDNLIIGELRLVDPSSEIGAFQRSSAIRLVEGRLGTEGREHCAPIGCRVGQGQAAADRAAVADRAIGEARRDVRHQAVRRVGHPPVLDHGMGDAGAEGDAVIICHGRRQLRQPRDVDQQRR